MSAANPELPALSIEYCLECCETLRALHDAQEILMEYEDRISQLTLVPGENGMFEVAVGASLVFSNSASGDTPRRASWFDWWAPRSRARPSPVRSPASAAAEALTDSLWSEAFCTDPTDAASRGRLVPREDARRAGRSERRATRARVGGVFAFSPVAARCAPARRGCARRGAARRAPRPRGRARAGRPRSARARDGLQHPPGHQHRSILVAHQRVVQRRQHAIDACRRAPRAGSARAGAC